MSACFTVDAQPPRALPTPDFIRYEGQLRCTQDEQEAQHALNVPGSGLLMRLLCPSTVEPKPSLVIATH
jgi:hypothetical protein